MTVCRAERGPRAMRAAGPKCQICTASQKRRSPGHYTKNHAGSVAGARSTAPIIGSFRWCLPPARPRALLRRPVPRGCISEDIRQSSPRWIAATAACARFSTPSLLIAEATCAFTVRSAIPSAVAICLLGRPSAMSRSERDEPSSPARPTRRKFAEMSRPDSALVQMPVKNASISSGASTRQPWGSIQPGRAL